MKQPKPFAKETALCAAFLSVLAVGAEQASLLDLLTKVAA